MGEEGFIEPVGIVEVDAFHLLADFSFSTKNKSVRHPRCHQPKRETAVVIKRAVEIEDDGTYVNFSLAHTFTLVGDDDDPTLTFTPSVGQGFGDKHRTRGYGLADDHAGLMDTTIMGEFEWALCDHVALTAYVAYSDYWFDSKLRHGAREYNGAWSHGSKYADSWNFYGGVGVTVSF